MDEEISVKRGFHVPPLTAAVKESKKKRKDTNKEKKKSSNNGVHQSKNSEKLHTQQWTNGDMSDAPSKGHGKAKERKRSKNPKLLANVVPVPTEEDKHDLTHQEQDSLRWDGVLEDPDAEAQRLEIYRAKRRMRYIASKQAFLQNKVYV